MLRSLAEHRGVVLLGAAGVGKTRLAAEVLDRVRRTGTRVSDCYATVAASVVPFGALAGLLPADLRSANPLRAAVELVPPGLLLAVDDAHLLDQASIALLQHLVRHRDTRLLLTARTMPWHDDALVRIELGNLTRAESDELVGTAGDQAELWARTQGNPLYLTELLRGGAMTGKLGEAIGATVGTLDTAQRHALELLSYGEPLRLTEFARLATDEVVDALEERGLVSVRDARVRLGHPLYGEFLRDTCPTMRSREHQRRLADAVPDDPLRVAIWRLHSSSEISAEELVYAAGLALAAYDVGLAERLCDAAIERGSGVDAVALLGQVLLYGRRPDEAEVLLTKAMAATDDPVELARLGLVRAGALFYAFGQDVNDLLLALDVPALPAEISWYVKLVRITCATYWATDEEIRQEIAALGDPPDSYRRSVELVAAQCGLTSGDYGAALAALDRLGVPRYSLRAPIAGEEDGFLRLRCHSLLGGGAIDEAEAYALRARTELVDDPRGLFANLTVATVLSRCAQLRGHAREAYRLMVEVIGESPEQLLIADVALLGELARAAALHGKLAEARFAVDRATSALTAPWRGVGFIVEQARTWLLAASGTLADAAEAAATTAERTRALGWHSLEAKGLHDAARFGLDTSDRLTELAMVMDDPMTRAYTVHALGRARGDAVLLDDAAARFTSMGATLYAAEALAERVRLHGGGVAGFRLAALLDKFDGVELPTLLPASAGRLTPRQLEVARLARSGLTNREIADRLTTSKRTVDNHLHAVYTTLGIGGRAELSAVLGH